jgi:hypothetical protein
MKNIFLCVLIVNTLLSANAIAQSSAEKLQVEVGKLTSAEYTFLSSIGNKDYGKLVLSKDVKRYYKLINGNKEYIQSELIYKKDEYGLIDGGYIYYNLLFIGDLSEISISYSYSLGRAASAYGSVIKTNDTMIQTEIGWGTSALTTIVLKNNRKIFEETKEF